MDIFRIFGALALKGHAEFTQGLQAAESQGRTTSAKLDSYFRKISTAVAAAFSVHAITSFTRTLVTASAAVSARTAQFNATFRAVGDAASEMFSRVSDSTSIMSERLQSVGTKAFSQLKGAGLDANAALAETERYLNLAADAAAYYDISLEDADMRLRSFIRGNVEAGDMIGLFTSETQRNSAALEAYGKKYIECSEAQKQMIMLNIAEEIYQQSGAIGQAQREGDAWENTVGNLREAWLQFTAALGQPVMETLLPVIRNASEMLQGMASWLERNKETVEAWLDVLLVAVAAIGSYAAALGALSIIQKVTSWLNGMTVAQKLLNTAMSANPAALLAAAIGGAAIAISRIESPMESLSSSTDALLKTTEDYSEAVSALKGNTDDLTEAQRNLYERQVEIARLESVTKINDLAEAYIKVQGALKGYEAEQQTATAQLSALEYAQSHSVEENLERIKTVETLVSSIFTDGSLHDYYSTYLETLRLNADILPEAIQEDIGELQKYLNDLDSSIAEDSLGVKKSLLAVAQAYNAGLADIDPLKLIDEDLYNEVISTVHELGASAAKAFSEAIASEPVIYSDSDKVLQDMEARLKSVDVMSEMLGDSFDAAGEKSRIYRNALKELAEQGFRPGSAAVDEIRQKLDELEGSSFEDRFKDIASSIANAFSTAASYASDFFGALFDMTDQALEQQISAIDEELEAMEERYEKERKMAEEAHEAESESLLAQLKYGDLTQQEYLAKKKALDESYDESRQESIDEEEAAEEELTKKKDELARRQFEAEKMQQISQVWIQAATAIMTSFAQLGWPLGLAAVPAVTAVAGIQAKTISDQEYTPLLAKGGIIDRPTRLIAGEDGPEAIVPLRNNTEWTGAVADALRPELSGIASSDSSLIGEIRSLKRLLSGYLSKLLRKDSTMVLDSGELVGATAALMDRRLGDIRRRRDRR